MIGLLSSRKIIDSNYNPFSQAQITWNCYYLHLWTWLDNNLFYSIDKKQLTMIDQKPCLSQHRQPKLSVRGKISNDIFKIL